MTEVKVRRSQVATFINTTPSATATYVLLGVGIVNSGIDYNPETSKETYIHQNGATTEVEGYGPTMKIEQTAVKGNPAFDYLDGLRKTRPTLDDAHTDIVNVWMYETSSGSPASYPAEKQDVSVQFDNFGGEGGKPAKINYTLNFIGDLTSGSFVPSTLAWTPSA